MRAEDVSSRSTDPRSAELDSVRADLLYEFELELRRTAKTIVRSVPPGRVLIARESTQGKSVVTRYSDTGLRGWMVGPRLALLEDGGWVPYTQGRTHKLDKPRHSKLFGDSTTREYAEHWQNLTDVGVQPGATYVTLPGSHEGFLATCRDPRRAEIFEVQVHAGVPHLVFTYSRGAAGSLHSVLRDDLQKWMKDYA
ncbi:hypothetical protein [Sanguibacter sp. HDW7]|uniref:hypothetical protein n=1 Tax=Sanguibacter sp. HDW7 TaxID=2714931 RepID=UPI0014077D40|nr:hypothetical protein [Sanguibacter sp. HDW7]QIK83835.1 hypothetical protein G7063_09515 [Sanguibacter sp. HDW7]